MKAFIFYSTFAYPPEYVCVLAENFDQALEELKKESGETRWNFANEIQNVIIKSKAIPERTTVKSDMTDITIS